MESDHKKRMELDLSILLSTKNYPPQKEIDSHTHSWPSEQHYVADFPSSKSDVCVCVLEGIGRRHIR
jgi:hypothetical protein